MSFSRVEPQPGDRLRRAVAGVLTILLVATAVVVLHGPSTRLALTGDSYQWIQHAHAATHDWSLFLVDLDSFLRPSNTWSLALDRIVWGGFDAGGFRLSSLLIHAIVGLALAVAARRLGLGHAAAAAVALVWVTSPFSDESAFVVAYRFQPLLLLSWLALIAIWPRGEEGWTRGRICAALIAVFSAAAAKETWVVTPLLVAALEFDRRRSLREAIRPTILVGLGVVLYVVVYFVVFPGSKSYYQLGEHIIAKIPTQLAAFLYLREPMPFELSLTWQGVLALVAAGAMVVACVRWRVPGTWSAVALFLAPSIPTILVPYMPQRYLAIPYAGFLLLAALWLSEVARRQPRWRLAVRGGAAAVTIVVVIAGAAIVRDDLADYTRMADAHQILLDQARAVAPVVAAGDPVAVIRNERAQPLLEILREPAGFAKLPYTRHSDSFGLIDTAALFEWVIAEEGTIVRPVPDWASSCGGAEGRVLVHHLDGFVDGGRVDDLALEAQEWKDRPAAFRVIRSTPAGGS